MIPPDRIDNPNLWPSMKEMKPGEHGLSGASTAPNKTLLVLGIVGSLSLLIGLLLFCCRQSIKKCFDCSCRRRNQPTATTSRINGISSSELKSNGSASGSSGRRNNRVSSDRRPSANRILTKGPTLARSAVPMTQTTTHFSGPRTTQQSFRASGNNSVSVRPSSVHPPSAPPAAKQVARTATIIGNILTYDKTNKKMVRR